MEVRLPDADTLVPIERFKERLALGLGKVEHAARVRIVREPAVRRPAADDDLLIAGLQRLLLDLSYPRIAEGRAIIRRPLEEDRKSTRELQSLTRISYAVFCLKKKQKP